MLRLAKARYLSKYYQSLLSQCHLYVLVIQVVEQGRHFGMAAHPGCWVYVQLLMLPLENGVAVSFVVAVGIGIRVAVGNAGLQDQRNIAAAGKRIQRKVDFEMSIGHSPGQVSASLAHNVRWAHLLCPVFHDNQSKNEERRGAKDSGSAVQQWPQGDSAGVGSPPSSLGHRH